MTQNILYFINLHATFIASCDQVYHQGYPTCHIEDILPKGPYPPCLRMADRALLAGYHRYMMPALCIFDLLKPPPKRSFIIDCAYRFKNYTKQCWSLIHKARKSDIHKLKNIFLQQFPLSNSLAYTWTFPYFADTAFILICNNIKLMILAAAMVRFL